MAKSNKKKRNKPYRGEDAAIQTPTIHRFSAVQRNAAAQWWHDNRRIIKPIGIGAIVLVIVVWLIVEAVRVIF